MTHRIRLRRPWIREVFCDGQLVHRAERVNVPDTRAACEIPTGVDVPEQTTKSTYHAIYRRHFNCPTGLEEGDRLSIEINPAIEQPLEVRLNDSVIGSDERSDTVESGREVLIFPLEAQSIRAQSGGAQSGGQNQIAIEIRSEDSTKTMLFSEVALRIESIN